MQEFSFHSTPTPSRLPLPVSLFSRRLSLGCRGVTTLEGGGGRHRRQADAFLSKEEIRAYLRKKEEVQEEKVTRARLPPICALLTLPEGLAPSAGVCTSAKLEPREKGLVPSLLLNAFALDGPKTWVHCSLIPCCCEKAGRSCVFWGARPNPEFAKL